jgi:hypothetical protein
MTRTVPRLAMLALSAFTAATLAPLAQAHEFWLEPSSFTPRAGGLLAVRHCVGDGFDGWSLARNIGRIERFVVAGASGDQAIVGLDGADPAGVVRLTSAGHQVLVYRSNRAFQEMPADKFEEYLKDKGLERISATRKARGAGRRDVREAYSRHAKALIRTGDTGGGPIDRVMGLRLELVADPDLFRAGRGDRHSFRLLFDGRPLAGALVAATRPGTADEDRRVRTDAEGRAEFSMRHPGMWRVAAVHMMAAPAGIDADWESLWASLTFELAATSAADAAVAKGPACRNRILAPVTVAQR